MTDLEGCFEAQPAGKVAWTGRLSPFAAEADQRVLGAFRKGLAELGRVEEQHFTMESRSLLSAPIR